MKNILLDVDGVVANFVKGLELALDHKFSPDDLKQWDVLDSLTQEKKEEALDILSGPGFWRTLPLIDGAVEVVHFWDNLGHDITWLTSPWASCESWESARRDWLDKHFNLHKNGHHYIPTSSKEKVDGDVFIDDKPENIKKWLEAHPQKRAFLYDAPSNQHFDMVQRLTWKKAKDLV